MQVFEGMHIHYFKSTNSFICILFHDQHCFRCIGTLKSIQRKVKGQLKKEAGYYSQEIYLPLVIYKQKKSQYRMVCTTPATTAMRSKKPSKQYLQIQFRRYSPLQEPRANRQWLVMVSASPVLLTMNSWGRMATDSRQMENVHRIYNIQGDIIKQKSLNYLKAGTTCITEVLDFLSWELKFFTMSEGYEYQCNILRMLYSCEEALSLNKLFL